MIRRTIKFIKQVNLKTIIFNLRYFDFKTAIKLPVLVSKNVYLHTAKGRIIIKGPLRTGMIQIGYGNVIISDRKYARAVWEVYGDVVFNGKASIAHGSKIFVDAGAELILGNDFFMSTACALLIQRKIIIGDNCGISWETLIMDTDFHNVYDNNGEVLNAPRPVIIESNVWIGCRCTLLKGALIPAGSIIAANSVVTKKLTGTGCVFGGNPARLLKQNVVWKY